MSIEECRKGTLQPLDPARARDRRKLHPLGRLQSRKGMYDETRKVIQEVARLVVEGQSKWQIGKRLYVPKDPNIDPDPNSAHDWIKKLFHNHGREITLEVARLRKRT